VTVVASDAARAPSLARDHAADGGIPRWIATAVVLGSAVLFYALSTHGTFNPGYEQAGAPFSGRFFLAQAHALVKEQLHVSPNVLPGECFIHSGVCYGYFGLTPSLLRVPFLPLLDATGRALTSVYLTLALALAVGSAIGIASRVLAPIPRTPLTTFLKGAVLVSLGPASVLVMLTRPAVYEEAIAWSVGFALLGIYCLIRWWSAPNWRWAAAVVIALTLSTTARPTTLPLAVLVGIGIAVRAVSGRSDRERARRQLAFAATAAILPVVACLGVFWAKFGTPVPSLLLNQQFASAPWWLAIRRVDHNSLQGIRFMPTNLLAYLRPDGVVFASGFPWVDFRFPAAGIHLVGIPRGSEYLEPFSTVPDDMPLAVVAVIAGLAYGGWNLRRRGVAVRDALTALVRSPMTYVIIGTAGSAALTLTNAFITNRYLGDMFPLIAVSLILAVRLLAEPAARLRGPGAVAVACGVTVLLAWTVLINIGLQYQWWWHTVP
jgi:hypothetical protein